MNLLVPVLFRWEKQSSFIHESLIVFIAYYFGMITEMLELNKITNTVLLLSIMMVNCDDNFGMNETWLFICFTVNHREKLHLIH